MNQSKPVRKATLAMSKKTTKKRVLVTEINKKSAILELR